MQSSNLKSAIEIRDSYKTDFEKSAFESGYNHAHGIACHNVPEIGETYFTDGMGKVVCDSVKIAREIHESLCYEAESNKRCYSPWEFTAHEINSLPEFDSESAWEAYDSGVALAIQHDLESYSDSDYGFEDYLEELAEKINAIAESRVEYETTHKDSGDNYACLVPESWSNYHDEMLVGFLAFHGINWQGLELEDIAREILEDFDMISGHIFSGTSQDSWIIDSFPISEIEIQIDSNEIGQSWTKDLCEILSRKSDVYLRYLSPDCAFGYQASDCVWNAEISESKLREIVKDLHARN
jgi:hypothetical protein